jgi:hypothetical protein
LAKQFRIMKAQKYLFFLLIPVIFIASCKSVGPGTLNRDRTEYLNAYSDSWKKQLLQNIVRIRYADAPVMMDISSIISQYEISGQFTAGASYEPTGIGWNPSVGAQGTMTDRPTISYEPVSGEKFALSLMQPIPTTVIMSLVYAGYPIDQVFKLTVNSINGIKNNFGGSARRHEASPEFFPLLDCFKKLQGKDFIDITSTRISETKEELFIEIGQQQDTAVSETIKKMNQILGIPDSLRKYRVGIGIRKNDSLQFAIMTRSILEILADIGAYIHVPEAHILAKEVYPEPDFKMPDGTPVQPFINIYSSKQEPVNAFVSVYYNGYWFYIDKAEYRSKGIFSFLLLISSLVQSDEKATPMITIPTR